MHFASTATAVSGIVLATLSSKAAAQTPNALTINTPPSLITCQPTSLTWANAKPPVYVSVLKGGDLSSAPLRQFPQQADGNGAFPWNVDLPSGTQVTLQVRDSTGMTQSSAPVNILAGPDGKQCEGNGNNTQTPSGAPAPTTGAATPPANKGAAGGSGSGSSSASSPPAGKPDSGSQTPPSTAPTSSSSSGSGSSSSNTTTPPKKNGAATVAVQPIALVIALGVSTLAAAIGQGSL